MPSWSIVALRNQGDHQLIPDIHAPDNFLHWFLLFLRFSL
jgi:hypothetical protein